MITLPQQITAAIQALSKLPGIGPKTASRLVYHLIKKPQGEVESLGQALLFLKKDLRFCEQCFQITDQNICSICSNTKRSQKQIMVVEEPLDVMAFERMKEYEGVYHVLHGILKPMDGIGPELLKIAELLSRVKTLQQKGEKTVEVILSVSPSLEGESTSSYIAQLLRALPGVEVMRIGVGIPIGSSVEYADEITLSQAFHGRRVLSKS